MVANQRTSLKGQHNHEKNGVDRCWHIAILGFILMTLVTGIMVNVGFFYVFFMEDFGIDRETASWPSTVLTLMSKLACKWVKKYKYHSCVLCAANSQII